MPISQFVFKVLARRQPFYVISHERSGTHFAINTLFRNTYILQNFHYVGDWLGPYENPDSRYRHIIDFRNRWSDTSRNGGIIKCHCDAALFSRHFPSAPVVYVLRDPRDTLVSFFYYLNNDQLYQTNPGIADQRCVDFSEFLRRPASDYLRWGFYENPDFENVVGRWAHHVSGWLQRPGICVIRYEDLKRNFKSVVHKVCRHVGLIPRLLKREIGLKDAASVLPRKGMVGDWKRHFKPQDEAFLEKELRRFGLSIDRFDVGSRGS